eukprot:1143702-Pelagomonas_calceolata.AAC.2
MISAARHSGRLWLKRHAVGISSTSSSSSSSSSYKAALRSLPAGLQAWEAKRCKLLLRGGVAGGLPARCATSSHGAVEGWGGWQYINLGAAASFVVVLADLFRAGHRRMAASEASFYKHCTPET